MSEGEEFHVTPEGIEVYNKEIGRQILEEALKIIELRQKDPKFKGKSDTYATEANVYKLVEAAVSRLRLKQENFNDALHLITDAFYVLDPLEKKPREEIFQKFRN